MKIIMTEEEIKQYLQDKPHAPNQAERECFFCEPLPCTKREPKRPDVEGIRNHNHAASIQFRQMGYGARPLDDIVALCDYILALERRDKP